MRNSFSQKESGQQEAATVNGNTLHSGTHVPDHDHDDFSAMMSAHGLTSNARDQNANPVASSSNSNSTETYPSRAWFKNSGQGKFQHFTNHASKYNHNTIPLDGDHRSLTNKRSQDRESGSPNVDLKINPSGSTGKITVNSNEKTKEDDDDDTDEVYQDPSEFTGELPSQYLLPTLTKFNATSRGRSPLKSTLHKVILTNLL